MATLANKIKLYLEANSKVYETERDAGNYVLINNSDGLGDIIESWNVSGLAEPTPSQLATYESDGNTYESNVGVQNTRRDAYGNIGDQLDEIYKDIDAWKTRIKAIKDGNPKS